MTYCAALERLYALTRFGEKLALDGPRALERTLGQPLGLYRSVLIGGTNGKGSTSAFLERALRHAGVRTGRFTSPHLYSFTERILIDGAPIAREAVARLSAHVLERAEAAQLAPSFFEAAWGMAALAFAEAQIDVAIWEVGLGGRLDATNVCQPEVSAITSLGLDHTAVLGPTLAHIAREKAAIFRAQGHNLSACQGEAAQILRAESPHDFEAVEPLDASIALPLAGDWQRANAALALAMARALGHPTPAESLRDTRWPGRLQELAPDLYLDSAHNPPAAEVLAGWLAEQRRPAHVIFGAMADKDVRATFAPLAAHAASVCFVSADHPRRLSAADLAQQLRDLAPTARAEPDVLRAIEQRPPGALCLVAGSSFLAGEVLARTQGQPWPECALRTLAR